MAETFTFAGEADRSFGDVARLDTMVTVVDAFNFLRDYSSRDSLQSRGESLGEQDAHTVVDLLSSTRSSFAMSSSSIRST